MILCKMSLFCAVPPLLPPLQGGVRIAVGKGMLKQSWEIARFGIRDLKGGGKETKR